MPLKPSIATVVLFGLVVVQHVDNAQQQQQQMDVLQAQNFRVEARLKDMRKGGSEEIKLSEVYSNVYKRSLIKVSASNGLQDDGGGSIGPTSYYITEDISRLVRRRTKPTSCEQIGVEEFLSSALAFPAGHQGFQKIFEEWAKPMDGVPNHVLGVARLLFVIQANRAKMNRVTESGKQFIKYKLNVEWGQLVDVSIEAFYSRELADGANNLYPLQVWLKSEQLYLLLVDFYIIEPIFGSPFKYTNYHMDLTTLPLGAGCSTGQFRRLTYLALSSRLDTFSMRIETIDHDEQSKAARRSAVVSSGEHFIAYDAKQSALRRDTIVSMTTATKGGTIQREYLTTIYDLKKWRRYNVKFAVNELDDDDSHEDGNRRSRLGQMNELGARDCIGSKLNNQADFMSLLPVDQLAHVGHGRVRGLEVDIYESISDQLPVLFFPPAQLASGPTGSGKKGFFSTVYYFARTDSRETSQANGQEFLDKLVRVDVFYKGILHKQINVYNFIWQLGDAPNGDRQGDLFALHYSCTRGGGGSSDSKANDDNSRVWLRMKLESSFATVQLGNIADDSKQLASGSLQNGPGRNGAIRRALSVQSRSLSTTQIHNLHSTTLVDEKKDAGKLKIVTNVGLSLPSDDLFVPKLIGSGRLLSSASSRLLREITNFDDCFHEACRKRKSEHILFAFTSAGQCFIDERPIFERKKGAANNDTETEQEILFTYSNIFRLLRRQEVAQPEDVQIMQVDLINEGTQSAGQAWQEIYDDLASLSSMLSLVTHTGLARDNEPKETISLFKIVSCEWLDMRGNYANLNPIDLTLAGIGLASGHQVTRTGSDGEPQMDRNTCRSVCSADMECQSYSICVIDQEIECKLSEFDLKSSALASQVEIKRNQLKKDSANNMHIGFLEIEVNKENKTQLIKLKLNKRCQIYQKRVLDMFIPSRRSTTILDQKVIAQVDSEEDCARECVKRNVEFLKKMTELNYEQQTDSLSSAAKVRKVYRENQKRWCATFRYIDLRSSTAGSRLIRSKKLGHINKNGLCLLPERLTNDHHHEHQDQDNSTQTGIAVKGSVSLEMDTFSFAYVNLYEISKGIGMLPYPAEQDEQIDVSSNSTKGYEVENRRKVIETETVESCARACFMQTTELLPWCKSFEFVEIRSPSALDDTTGEQGSTTTRLCAFNSMSLAEAKRAGIGDKVISTQSDDMISVHHYEPRDAYTMNDRILKTLIMDSVETKSIKVSTARGSPVGTLFLIGLGILTGIALASKSSMLVTLTGQVGLSYLTRPYEDMKRADSETTTCY